MTAGGFQVLLVVATPPEASFFAGLPGKVTVAVSGIGAVNAALTTLQEGLQQPFDLILNAGIAGAFPGQGLQIGDVALSSRITHASLGAEDLDGSVLDLGQLGFPLHPPFFNQLPVWDQAEQLARQVQCRAGEMLTVDTATGTAHTLQRLQRRYPEALTEGMEGAGVALAALRLGVPVLEVRGISNMVGPRDRSSWQIGKALQATRTVLEQLLPLLSQV